MDLPDKLFFTVLLILAVAVDETLADATVTGTVFCDQCKDGQISVFDYPVYGAKVTVSCGDGTGQILMSREETTNFFGSYTMRFDEAPDLSSCSAHVSGTVQGSMGCGEPAGPSQNLRLTFKMFGMEMYAVGPLLVQPAQPMQYCPKPPKEASSPPLVQTVPPPKEASSPPPPLLPPLWPKLPPFSLPPFPGFPPLPLSMFAEDSPCPHEKWTMPEYKCYWRAVKPDTKVAAAFGIVAERRYGREITLWKGLEGRGDPYKTLLREGVTALLNSYNGFPFSYSPLGVVQQMNMALMGSSRSVLRTALSFKKANSGAGASTCKFTPCK